MKKIEIRSLLILALGSLTAFTGAIFFSSEFLIFIGLGIMVSSIIYHLIFYRCPHCGKYLYRNNGDFCQYCGKNLNEK